MHDFGEDLGDEYYKARYRTMLEEGGFEKLKDELSEELYAGNCNKIVMDYAADILSGKITRHQGRQPVPEMHKEIIYFYKRLLANDWPKNAIPSKIADIMCCGESIISKRLKKIRANYGMDSNQWPVNLSDWDEFKMDEKLLKKNGKTKKAK